MPRLIHSVDRKALQRVNLALGLGVIWGGLAFCAIAAALYDIDRWIGAW